jgi:hypothetical protein
MRVLDYRPNASSHWSLTSGCLFFRMETVGDDRYALHFIVLAQHGEESKFCGLGQKFIVALKPSFLIRQFQMNVEILASAPIFIKIKYIWIVIADVEMVLDAAGFGSRSIDKAAQKFDKFCPFLWASVQSSCEGATWFHNFLGLAFHHAASVQAIWFFDLKRASGLDARLFEPRQSVETRVQSLKGKTLER